MQKSRDGGRNNAYQIFSNQVEEGNIPNTISYVKLFMTTMRTKNNFCNGYQHEMQKNQNGGGNNPYKIFTSRVEKGNIPNTISYVKLFMNTLKMKNNFCNGHQYEMQKSQDGGGNNAYQIFSGRLEEGNIPNTISYVKLFMTTMKMKNNLCNRYQDKMQKSQNGGGNNAYKIFTSRVEEGNILNTISYVKLFMTTIKIKNNFCKGQQYEMQKSQYRGENNAYKIIMCRLEERNIMCKHKTCLELFIATMKKKQFSESSKK